MLRAAYLRRLSTEILPATEPTSHFIFATCRAGSESLLKAEVATNHKKLKPAFMRPQLVSWKSDKAVGREFAVRSIFARTWGLSLGMFATLEEITKRVAEFPGIAFHLHVFPRSAPEDGVLGAAWEKVDAKREALAAALVAGGISLQLHGRPKIGEWVLDVIVGNDDEPLFLGAHQHSQDTHPLPGGLPRLVIPEAAPSRAWLKLEQALAFAGFDKDGLLKNKVALELGCAPGGATYAMLNRGMRVIGVDPAEMAPSVTEFRGVPGASFTHLPVSVNAITRKDVPAWLDLLVSDMNLAPTIALRQVERIQSYVHAQALIITVKINDPAMQARIHDFIKHVRHFAPEPVRVTQLPANRSEICIVAGEF